MTINYRVRVPSERIGVLIGPGGSIKKKLEAACKVCLNIDSETGEVEITAEKIDDPTVVFKIQNMISAIGRGFSPEKALRLLNDDIMFDVIDLRDYFGRSKSDIRRVKARLIGTKGKTRRIIEDTTNVGISVYGHTVSFIGKTNELEVAKEAVRRIIEGSQHKSMYHFLGRKRHEIKKERLKLWEEKGAV